MNTSAWASRLVAAAPPAIVALVVVVNAWAGLMPGVGFWDTGEFQTVLPIMGTAHPTGYPTYVLVGFVANLLLAPLGEPAFRITVLSLLAVATAAGALTVLVRQLSGSTIVGAAAGLGLAATPVVWVNATRADPHPIHLAFVAILMVLLVRWQRGRAALRQAAGVGSTTADAPPTAGVGRAPDPAAGRWVDRRLLVAAVVFGVAAGNHSLTLLLVPAIGLYVLSVEPGIWRRPLFIATCLVAAVGAAALVYLELPVRGGIIPAPLVYGRPDTWDGFWYIALAEQFRGSLGDPFENLPAKVDALVQLVDAQLGLVALAIPAAVVVAAIRAPRYMLLSGTALVATVLFNQAYANADIERYYLGPVLWIWSWLGILGAELAEYGGALVVSVLRGRAGGPGGGAARRATAAVAAIVSVVLLFPSLADLGPRRQAADRSRSTEAEVWLDEVLPVIDQDAVVVSWWSTSTALWYARFVEGLRPDIVIVDDRTMLDQGLGRAPDVIRRYLGTRPVYVIRLQGRDTDELTGQFDMTQVASGGSTTLWAVHGERTALP